jgi:hypothetical protein
MLAQGYILGYCVGNVLELFPNIGVSSSRKVQM